MFRVFGLVFKVCLICPMKRSRDDVILKLARNFWQCSMNTGYRYGSTPWSKVGKRWWRVWSPKNVITLNRLPLMSVLSMTASSSCIPQSGVTSLLFPKENRIKQYYNLFWKWNLTIFRPESNLPLKYYILNIKSSVITRFGLEFDFKIPAP